MREPDAYEKRLIAYTGLASNDVLSVARAMYPESWSEHANTIGKMSGRTESILRAAAAIRTLRSRGSDNA